MAEPSYAQELSKYLGATEPRRMFQGLSPGFNGQPSGTRKPVHVYVTDTAVVFVLLPKGISTHVDIRRFAATQILRVTETQFNQIGLRGFVANKNAQTMVNRNVGLANQHVPGLIVSTTSGDYPLIGDTGWCRQVNVAISALQTASATSAAAASHAADTRVCPYCAEEIKAAALVCRFCNRDIPAHEGGGIAGSAATGQGGSPTAAAHLVALGHLNMDFHQAGWKIRANACRVSANGALEIAMVVAGEDDTAFQRSLAALPGPQAVAAVVQQRMTQFGHAVVPLYYYEARWRSAYQEWPERLI